MLLRVITTCFLALLLALLLLIGLLARGTHLPLLTRVIEREASEALNRQVALDSPPYVKIGREIRVRITGLSVANAPWAGSRPLLSLAEASVSLASDALFEEPLVIDHLRIDGVSLNLQRNTNGQSNLPTSERPVREEPASDAEESPLPVLRTLELNEISVRHRNDQQDSERHFVIHGYTTEIGADSRLVLAGAGEFQGKAWTIAGDHSGVESLVDREQLWGRLTGEIGELKLTASYDLPTLEHLRDVTAHVALAGDMPARLAELSPVFAPDSPIAFELDVSDIDPGIALDAQLRVEALELVVQGEIDRPGEGDGLNLSIDLEADSLPRLAAALGLGSTDEVALAIDGRLVRNGRHVQLRELLVRAGNHQITGSGVIPEFPSTSGADFDLRASGPEFAFYQRLARRPFEARLPYEIDLQLHRAADDRESIDALLQIGGASVSVTGALGDFPSYKDSDLRLGATSEDLSQIGDLLELSLPAVRIDAEAEMHISEDGRATIRGLRTTGAGAEAIVEGSFDTYPDLDNLDARINLRSPSLADTAAALGTQGLGEVPIEVSAAIAGSLKELALSEIALTAGSSSMASRAGSLTLSEPELTSDLVFGAAFENLPAILGNYAPEAMPTAALRFTLKPVITKTGYDFSLSDLDGPGLRGGVDLRIGRELQLDDDAYLSADLIIESPRSLLPSIPGFTPAAGPLELLADTRGDSGRIDASLRSAGEDLLALSAQRLGGGSAQVTLRGDVPDLRILGAFDILPDGPLPSRIDLVADLEPDRADLEIRDLVVGASELRGQIEVTRSPESLAANLELPKADLTPWLEASGQDDDPEPEEADSEGTGRIFSDAPLPLTILDGAPVDVQLRTGPLGLQDPFHPDGSLVDSADLYLSRRDGRANLEIRKLTGSRGTLQGEVAVERSKQGAQLTADLHLDDFPIGITAAGASLAALPQHKVDANLGSSGSSMRDLAANLDGAVFLTGGEGTLNDMSLSFATESFLQQLLTTLLPADSKEERDMRVECTVLAARAESGVITLNPGFVMRSERVDLSARGTMDLNRERLAIRFDNQARKGLGISAASLVNPYVQITGTLARPAIGLDLASSAIAGGAAVASGGLTVIAKPLYGRFLDRRNPCEIAIDRWERTAGT